MKYNLAVGILIAIVGWRMKAAKPLQGWLSVVMGLWFAVAVFFPPFNEGDGFLWNNVIGGTLVAIIGFTALAYVCRATLLRKESFGRVAPSVGSSDSENRSTGGTEMKKMNAIM